MALEPSQERRVLDLLERMAALPQEEWAPYLNNANVVDPVRTEVLRLLGQQTLRFLDGHAQQAVVSDHSPLALGIERLLHECRKLSPSEWTAFLDVRAPTEEIRAAVSLRLQSASHPSSALPTSAEICPAARLGEQIGPYRIIEKIGEGGMGAVYLVEQRAPVRRKVALKIIRRGMTSSEVLTRFQAEHQVLALMSHPNIAGVLDAGSTADERPYFVMEFVPGLPITEYCDRHRLTVRERLELFAQVCLGVQHAHLKGIIHRDLKPTNILVLQQDDRPVPKIIDFGIAKATGQRLTEKTHYTEVGRIMGTPEYMSPEQAEMKTVDIDTRTDVYSLGVLLYELLVGVLPFDSRELREAGYSEIQRIIREREPPTPSSRLITDAGRSDTAAERRRTDIRQLLRGLRGDLDWITMRCLEKDRSRRYESVSQLAEDVRRHLNDEPVRAGPPSTLYRVQKFVRKHRVGVASTAAITLALVVGLGWALFERGVAKRHLEEITRLSDIKRLEVATEAADALWPTVPERVMAMESWLVEHAAPLQARLDSHREVLGSLRRRALEYDDLQRQADRETHPRVGELAAMRGERESFVGAIRSGVPFMRTPEGVDPAIHAARLQRGLANLDQDIGVLEAVLRERRTWKFADTDDHWKHDRLADLVDGLETFVDPDPRIGTIAKVRRRLAFASTVEERSRRGPEAVAAWNRTLTAIRASERYGERAAGLEPQLGLWPLGLDPASGLAEFLHLETHEGSLPRRDAEGRIQVRRETGIIFVLIPAGTIPLRSHVRTDRAEGSPPFALEPFFLSKFEMTQGQWSRFAGTNPSYYGPRFRGLQYRLNWTNPVENVSWNRCVEAMRQLDLMLPTSLQWEYAARARTTTPWWCGDDKISIADRKAGNLSDSRSRVRGAPKHWDMEPWEDDWVVHAPVGEFAPNPFGLHDVIGNVWEWCRDTPPVASSSIRPGDGENLAPSEGTRKCRGGSFFSSAARAAADVVSGYALDQPIEDVGVRPARAIQWRE